MTAGSPSSASSPSTSAAVNRRSTSRSVTSTGPTPTIVAWDRPRPQRISARWRTSRLCWRPMESAPTAEWARRQQTPLKLYNSLSREIAIFRPLTDNHVRIYTCGPTVYNYGHIGNLRAYVFADTLRRTLQWQGYDVTHVINITDVGHLTSDADTGDDKVELAARSARSSAYEITEKYTSAFFSDLGDLIPAR
jgi:hypothetical protein